MMSADVQRQRIGFLRLAGSLFARLLIAGFLIFATYNPTGRSYYHWMASGDVLAAWKVVTSGLLLVAYGVVVPVAVRALGFGGVVLTTGATTTTVWLLIETGYVSVITARDQTWVALGVLVVVLGVGLSWMTVARVLDGQLRTTNLNSL